MVFWLNRFLFVFIAVFTLTALQTKKSYAQYDPLRDIDSQLRVFFDPLCVPDTGRFLYEMSSHVISEGYFSDNSTDTLIMDTWYKLYEEFRKMAYDTTWILRHDTVFYRSVDYGKDTIMMDMIAYYFYTLHDSALTTDTFFNFDTTNYTISDKFPCELYPYINNRVFASCPTKYYLPYKEVIYRVDDDFIFHDQWHDIVANNWQIEIDFGDGAGWQNIPGPNAGAPFHYSANYSTAGPAYVKTRIFDPMTATYIMSSIAEVMVPNRSRPPEPSWKRNMPGVSLAGYDPCAESGEPLKKVIIVIEGYDPSNNFPNTTKGQGGIVGNRTTGDVYFDMVVSPGLADLRNFGYTFVVIDWHDSRIDMALNAHALKGVINWLKCEQMITADTGTHEQFVIIAESMGGLVARHAMCDMEQNWQTLNGCLDEKMHNTRLLITYDTPHDGVNIAMAYQHLFRDAGKFLLGSNTIMQAVAGGMSNFLLDGKSVKQMLLTHVDTRNPLTHQYTEHPDRTLFKTALAALGNYPQYCKMVAMSNGSLQGNGQTDILNGNVRNPHDYFIDWDTDIFASILGTEIQLFGTNVELRSTPNGSGNLNVYNQDLYRPHIRFQVQIVTNWPWPPRVRVRMNVGSTYWTSIGTTHHANNLEPYDVIPGSVEDAANSFAFDNTTQANGLSKSAINLFFGSSSPTFNPGSGTWTFTKAGGGVGRGNNGIRGLVSSTLSSDGLHFCFVPVFSALDYNLGTNYWTDIEATNIATKTAANPFDVITGMLRHRNNNVLRFNEIHVHTRNDTLGSWNNGNVSTDYVRYDSCIDNPHPGVVRMLNREIGDDTLWVNNRTAAWTCIYDAEKYIGIDEQNPYYEHPNFSTAHAIPGVYSKEDDYNSVNGTTIFMVRQTTANINFTNWPVSYPVFLDTIDWIKCCGNFMNKPGRGLSVEESHKKEIGNTQIPEGSFALYPNPINHEDLVVKFYPKGVSGSIQLYDMTGKKIHEEMFSLSDKKGYVTKTVNLNKSAILPGIYLVVVRNGEDTYRRKLVIQ